MDLEQFRLLADLLPEPMLLVSADGIVISASRRAHDWLGIDPAALTGKHLSQFTTQPAAEVAKYLARCATSREPVAGAFAFRAAGSDDPSQRRIEGCLLAAPSAGEAAAVVLRVVSSDPQSSSGAADRKVQELSRELAARARADETVRSERELLEITLSSIGDAVITTDTAGRVTFLNREATALTQWPAAEAYGRDVTEVFHIVHEETREPVESPIARALQARAVVGLPPHTVLIARDGTERLIDDSGAAIQDSAGAVRGAVVVFRDMTQRSRAERRNAVQYATARILAEAESFNVAIREIFHAICNHLLWDLGAFWILDAQADVLRCIEVCNPANLPFEQFEAATRDRTFVRGVGLPGRVWQSSSPEWIESAPDDPNFPRAPMARSAGLHGAFATPVMLGRTFLGVMEFFSRDVRPPDHELLEVMASLGHQVGQFIERKNAEQALRESEARKNAILESALDCIVSIDQHDLIIDWNPAAERTFGYTREQALGQPLCDLIIPASLREQHRRGLAHYLRTGEGPVLNRRIEVMGLRADGTEFPVELAIAPIHRDRDVVFTAYVRDITQRKRGEHERERLLEAERTARSAAEKASRLKDEFLSNVSHELRTPLNAILGWSQLISMEGTPPDQIQEGLGIIERNGRVQAQIIDELLDMSRIISGKIRLDVQPIDLCRVIEAATETVRPSAEAKQIQIRQALDLNAGQTRGDFNRLQQVIWNLLSNAIKFTDKGGQVLISLERIESRVEIAVRDTGQGIKPEFLPYVFDRFRQADASTSRAHGGLGIGLAIAKNLVELHGGTVRVQSAGEGQGTTFTVMLPVRAVDVGRSSDRQALRRGALDGSSADQQSRIDGIKILIVDDEPDARELVKRFLEEFGGAVTAAASAEEALALLKDDRFDVLLSDIGMPGYDGYELIRSVRKLGVRQGGAIPAAALTAFARSEDRQQAMLAGYQSHIAKPVDPLELLSTITLLVKPSAASN